MDENEKSGVKFVDGMSWFAPHEKAPDFVKGKISIEPNKLMAFLKANKEFLNDKGYFGVDVKKSKAGKIYLSLDTWKKLERPDSFPTSADITPDQIPF